MTEWVTRDAALAALGIRPQTLYAYVSRGRVGVRPDPADPRRSLYRADDVAALGARAARGRKTADIAASAFSWGEPALTTGVSTVRHGVLVYRGLDAVAWAESATLEATAALLWRTGAEASFAAPAAAFCGSVRGPGGAGRGERAKPGAERRPVAPGRRDGDRPYCGERWRRGRRRADPYASRPSLVARNGGRRPGAPDPGPDRRSRAQRLRLRRARRRLDRRLASPPRCLRAFARCRGRGMAARGGRSPP